MLKRNGTSAVTNSLPVWFSDCFTTERMDNHNKMSAYTTKFIIILTKGINCKELKIVTLRIVPFKTTI